MGGERGGTFSAGGITGGASLGNDATGAGGGVTGCVDVGVTGAAHATARMVTPRNKIAAIPFIRIHTFYLITYKIVVNERRKMLQNHISLSLFGGLD